MVLPSPVDWQTNIDYETKFKTISTETQLPEDI